jgi:hypothetical protein
MKKLIIFVCVTFIGLTAFCQNSDNMLSQRHALPDCWPGQHIALVYSYDFHFHRPRRNCESGFWFCTTNGHYEWACVPNSRAKYSEENLNTNKNLVYLDVADDYFTFRFPISLKLDKRYNANDLKTFNVDEALKFSYKEHNYELITGDYPTIESDTEIIVKVPVKKD